VEAGADAGLPPLHANNGLDVVKLNTSPKPSPISIGIGCIIIVLIASRLLEHFCPSAIYNALY
jgi:hypothetical protein